jgi:MFS family permease
VVPVTVAVFVAAVTTLVLGCALSAPGWLLPVLAGLAGASVPAVGALSAARWRRVLGSSHRLSTALSAESAVNDLAFLVGPVLVTTLSSTLVGWAGLALAGTFVAIGIAGLLTSVGTEPPPAPGGQGRVIDRRLLARPFAALFGANVAMGLFFGGVPVAITAFAVAQGAGALAGPISAVSGVLSLTAGVVYGATGSRRPLQMMIMAGVVIAVGAAGLAAVPTMPIMFLGYGLVGGCVALVLVPSAILVQRSTETAVYTQAMTWINSASAIGIAIAASAVGGLIQQHDWRAGFLGTGMLTAALPIILLIGYGALRRVQEGIPAQLRSRSAVDRGDSVADHLG